MDATYHTEKLPDEPIILTIMSPQFSIARHMVSSDATTRVILDAAAEPLFLVVDMTEVTLSYSDLMFAGNQGAKGEKPLWHHPMLRQMVLVTRSRLLSVGAKALNSPVFGNLDVRAFPTREEALAYCRAQREERLQG